MSKKIGIKSTKMKIAIIILVVIVVLLALAFIVIRAISSPISKEKGNMAIEKSLEKFVDKHNEVDNVILRLYSDSGGYDEVFVVDSRDNEEPIMANNPFHIASIGKTLTSTIFYMLDEDGILSIHDPINLYLDEIMLEKLFVHESIDYSNIVTIQHLLTHTSGITSYFDGPVVKGYTMQELLVTDLDRYWTPEELVAFSRDNQTAVGVPGEVFYYSDTGYMLLMLILEEVMGVPYYQVFHNELFDPLEMRDSYAILESSPSNESREDIMVMKFDGVDISKSKSISAGCADGGIVSTQSDLLIFFSALQNGELISEQSFEQMKDFERVYDKGIKYGTGMMSFNLSELAPILPNLSTIYGGVGATGTFMLYDESKDLYIIMNVGVLDLMEECVSQLIKVLMVYNRIQ